MASSLDTGGPRGVNIELNLTPAIDLMCCLVSFLLATAVWSQHARIATQGELAGHVVDGESPDPKIQIVLTPATVELWVAHTDLAPQVFAADAGHRDWAGLQAALARLRAEPLFEHRGDIDVAAEATRTAHVAYGDVVAAMDVAVATGFPYTRYVDPRFLRARQRW